MSKRVVPTAVLVAVAALSLAACSSTPSAPAPASSAPAAVGSVEPSGGTAQMVALCTQMVDGKLSPEDATALAEENGYVARVGTIDGSPQVLTMDLREDRFTFDVQAGAVVGCTYG